MMTRFNKINIQGSFLVILSIVCMLSVIGCDSQNQNKHTNSKTNVGVTEKKSKALNEPIKPLTKFELDSNMVNLGSRLFHDPRLSSTNKISCSSCHNLGTGGVDNLVVSVGVNGEKGDINSPTVYNSAFNFRQFWDGRSKTLEDQVDGPLTNPKEMGSNWEDVLLKLSEETYYFETFSELFSDGITKDNVVKSIADFERSLITVSRFDDYLNGDEAAITEEEKEGYKLFKSLGCISCHQGKNVGGNMFQTFGIADQYFLSKEKITEADNGKYNVTKKESDRYVFKVPSLRNIELTAPYLHDGSQKTLPDIVNTMVYYQLGRQVEEQEVDKLVKFLKTLTGKELKSTAK